MAEPPNPPVAIRITRPYADEDEFLARELDTLTRSSIVLLGAHPRPQGVVLRFEVLLTSGAALVRGEGRVTAYRDNAFEDLPGLTLRFTRLDSRSKALVDRAAALRDQKGRAVIAPSAARPVAAPSPPPGDVQSPRGLQEQGTDAAATGFDQESSTGLPNQSARSARRAPTAGIDLETTRAEAPRAKSRSEAPPRLVPTSGSAPPSTRDEGLARLRTRAKMLAPDDVKAILEGAKRR